MRRDIFMKGDFAILLRAHARDTFRDDTVYLNRARFISENQRPSAVLFRATLWFAVIASQYPVNIRRKYYSLRETMIFLARQIHFRLSAQCLHANTLRACSRVRARMRVNL